MVGTLANASAGRPWLTPPIDRIVDCRATLGAALASGSAFLAVLVLVVSGLATGPDIAVLRWAASLHGGPLDVPMIALSGLGVSSALAFFSAFAATLLWATGARRAGVFVLTTWIGGYGLTRRSRSSSAGLGLTRRSRSRSSPRRLRD